MTNSSVTLLTRIGTLLFIVLFSTTQNTGRLRAQETKLLGAQSLSDEQVVQLAELALKGINQEFPNKPSNIIER